MLFNSSQFILAFLPITFFVYFGLNKMRLVLAGKAWLVFANLAFYSFWNIKYLPLILGSMLFNFAIGTALNTGSQSPKYGVSRQNILFFGIATNLITLGYFKYTGFLIENFNQAFGSSVIVPTIMLPLAISFFTFQQIAYLVDSYFLETADYDFLNYGLFVTFFPQLIAGPIVHHTEMMPQFASPKNFVIRYVNVLPGLIIFGIGLFKKVAIADTFALWASAGFDGGAQLNFFGAWATSLSYTFQIYFDFSGYCDMAIGAALLFNIKLPLNFNSPYKALDIQDFWRRWHITLSRFLRNYLYIPLGGNRGSASNTYFNLMLTFVIGGLWHGATWMFVLWGALHGAALIIHRLWHQFDFRLPSWLAWVLTFGFVNITWVFFRAQTLDDARRVLGGMLDFTSIWGQRPLSIPVDSLAWAGTWSDHLVTYLPYSMIPYIFTYFAISISFIIIKQKNAYEIIVCDIHMGKLIYGIITFTVAIYCMFASTSSEFLYFNF